MSYFDDIQSGIRTTLKGLSLTLQHIRNATHRRTPEGIADANYFDQQNGLVTLQYPHEQLPIPDNGRYRLRNEIEDCIVCDKCAKVCPVDCITIDAIKATEEVGRASDGSPIRLYAAKFDIDMAKCCYCGLCTAVCPTECLTMDKKFDYSEFELGKLTYEFSNLTAEQADEKRSLYEQFLREKEEQKAAQVAAKAAAQPTAESAPVAKPKPAFRPTAKPAATPPPAEPANSEGSSIEHPLTDATPDEMQQIAQGGLETTKRPVFRPTKKTANPPTEVPNEAKTDDVTNELVTGEKPAEAPPKPKAPGGFRPTMKPPKPADEKPAEQPDPSAAEETPTPKPAFRPTMKPPKPVANDLPADSEAQLTNEESKPEPKARPAFRPTMKPKSAQIDEPALRSEDEKTEAIENVSKESSSASEDENAKPKPAGGFRPTMKPKVAAPPSEPANDVSSEKSIGQDAEEAAIEEPKPKPAFRPTMKPKASEPLPTPAEPQSSETDNVISEKPEEESDKPKPVFRPTMKPKGTPVSEPEKGPSSEGTVAQSSATQPEEAPKPKATFRPTMKPKVAPPKPASDDETASE
ncbi:4Fe-4S dicluster domain-containing protein [Spirosoma oryzicola]|uniref:4Fe-4S dicluster domain-containing protein n=1 Tax=Spirosoma oryzicola TaxID=2898794 RepID=UPI001E3A7F14|nr:4Fe-4S dicluster domain-containing protein [Spirosoma oryzicola]UHG91731.1 4Fe-4S dicluster domain-containing protein [Spirosoma oryzicola]